MRQPFFSLTHSSYPYARHPYKQDLTEVHPKTYEQCNEPSSKSCNPSKSRQSSRPDDWWIQEVDKGAGRYSINGYTKRYEDQASDDSKYVALDTKHTPRWDAKVEREHEAKNPGPAKARGTKQRIAKEEPQPVPSCDHIIVSSSSEDEAGK